MQLRDTLDLDTLPEFDLFFSMIVLQHNPPPLIALMLEKIAARLRPGGVAVFAVGIVEGAANWVLIDGDLYASVLGFMVWVVVTTTYLLTR